MGKGVKTEDSTEIAAFVREARVALHVSSKPWRSRGSVDEWWRLSTKESGQPRTVPLDTNRGYIGCCTLNWRKRDGKGDWLACQTEISWLNGSNAANSWLSRL